MEKEEAANKFVEKSSAHGLFNFDKHGTFKIGGISASIICIPTLVVQNHLLKKSVDKKKVLEAIYYSGKVQGRVAVKLLRDKFGIKSSKQIFDIILEQYKMIGLGKNEVVKFNEVEKYVLLKKTHSPYAEKYIQAFGYQKDPVCHFHTGTVAGVLDELFLEEVVAIEKSCLAQGRDSCVTEAFPRRILKTRNLTEQEKFQIPCSEDNYPEINKCSKVILYIKP